MRRTALPPDEAPLSVGRRCSGRHGFSACSTAPRDGQTKPVGSPRQYPLPSASRNRSSCWTTPRHRLHVQSPPIPGRAEPSPPFVATTSTRCDSTRRRRSDGPHTRDPATPGPSADRTTQKHFFACCWPSPSGYVTNPQGHAMVDSSTDICMFTQHHPRRRRSQRATVEFTLSTSGGVCVSCMCVCTHHRAGDGVTILQYGRCVSELFECRRDGCWWSWQLEHLLDGCDNDVSNGVGHITTLRVCFVVLPRERRE